MMNGFRVLLLGLCVLLGWCLLHAQGAADLQEQQAEVLFLEGEGRMKVAAYEEAILEFQNVLKRYPDTQTRYRAQFRMADALVALKQEREALNMLDTVVKEQSPEWSPQALARIGELYVSQQKYSEAFRAYREIITVYPDNPMVDHAHFAIGVTHFKLGHFELAAAELDQVGTVFAARVPDLQRVSPGDPLYVRLTEPNLVAAKATRLSITLMTQSGDTESLTLLPETEGGDHFTAPIITALGPARPNDGTLQLTGKDTVTVQYRSQYLDQSAEDKTAVIGVASNARLTIRDSDGHEIRGVVLSMPAVVEINDADRDLADGPDTITVDITTKRKDTEKLTLTETGEHTGVFRASLETLKGEPAPGSGKIETNAGLAEGSTIQLDDVVTVTYLDEVHLYPGDRAPRKTTVAVPLFLAATGGVGVYDQEIPKASLEIQTVLYKGRSLTQIAATYQDLGQPGKASINFRDALDQFQIILTKYPNAPEAEDALYGMYQNYVAQTQYGQAIVVINQIMKKYPQSARAPQALLELATLHVKREEFDRALALFQTLAMTARGTPMAEEAQYAICTTYLAMLNSKMDAQISGAQVNLQQVTFAFQEFVRMYPSSERAPDAMWQLVHMRFEDQDYQGTVDYAQRMNAAYGDNVMTGRALLLMAQAQVKIRDRDGAVQTLNAIIANYGGEAEEAKILLGKILKSATSMAKPSKAAEKEKQQ
jgi:TolA-binding protein